MKQKDLQTLKGFRDFLPGQAAERRKVFEKIKAVFEKYGFLPLETPALEYKSLLAGKYGEEGERLMYSFEDQGGRAVAMRYDLTVPLARIVTQYKNELPTPFKRYQIAPVWRADRPQKGRYREFTQCDIDTVGTDSIFADAEVIACLDAALRELGIKDIVIRVNNRNLLDGIMRETGIDRDKTIDAIRILDKLARAGEQKVRGELAGIGIQTKQADRLFEILSLDIQDTTDFVKRFEGIAGAGELAELIEILFEMNVRNYEVDLTLARGLDYYTGTIFEIVLPDAAEYGSIGGGGRYDGLIGKGGKEAASAVGGSVGIDRLLAALEELELVKYDEVFDVLVCNLEEDLIPKYLELTQRLRKAGIRTDFYYDSTRLDRQLKYADKKNVNFAIMLGSDEMEEDSVSLKNLVTGKQETVLMGDLVKKLKKEMK